VGRAAVVTLKVGCSQWPETRTMAVGLAGRVAAMPFRKSAMAFQAVGGFQSMKKQGPAPCGTNRVGIVWPAPDVLNEVIA